MTLLAVSEAQAAGARLEAACAAAGISQRTVERWRAAPGEDGRRGPRHGPGNALTAAEQARILAVMNSPIHRGLSPKQLVPRLADEGVYLGSESTIYRLQRRLGLRKGRRTALRSHLTRATTAHRASAPNQVWSWDITYLPTPVRGRFLQLYLVMDVWSRRIVGAAVHEHESADLAGALVRSICADSGVDPKGLVLHSDNGRAMRGSTMLATLQWLGVLPSFSRPHVSNDNPYSEALFRTLKHCQAYPRLPFANIEAARRWVATFVAWYNKQHLHSGIRYVTPDQRHFGLDTQILSRRHELYQRARSRNPRRWTSNTRSWKPLGPVALNPPRSAAEPRAA